MTWTRGDVEVETDESWLDADVEDEVDAVDAVGDEIGAAVAEEDEVRAAVAEELVAVGKAGADVVRRGERS